MHRMTSQEIIELLGLEPLPLEGGHFTQSYVCPENIPVSALPERYEKDMPFSTAIYALLTAEDFSAMHILETDEVYHFYGGDPLEMLLLNPDGSGEIFLLGNDLATGMRPQKVVQKGVWQGSFPIPNGSHGYSFIGTTMAPSFEWDDFALGAIEELCKKYPAFREQIESRVR